VEVIATYKLHNSRRLLFNLKDLRPTKLLQIKI
jgi:hypothetical protein